jgi:hypothetical protein
MTVRELIEVLNKCDQNALVYVWTANCSTNSGSLD